MRLIPYNAPQSTGKILLDFGKTGVGKSASTFQSATQIGPLLYLCGELRNAEISAQAVDIPRINPDGSINYVLAVYEDWPRLVDFVSNLTERITIQTAGIDYKDIKVVCIDGVTQVMTNLSIEIADNAAAGRGKGDKSFIIDTKLSQEGYGALASHMQRLMNQLVRQTQYPYNKYVVLSMLIEKEDSLWDSSQKAVPSLMGKQFPVKISGQCDLIGLVEDRYIADEVDETTKEIISVKKVYPPWIKFEEDFDADGNKRNFLCKWTGKRPTVNGKPVKTIMCPFDLKLIFNPPTDIISPKHKITQRKETDETIVESNIDTGIVTEETVGDIPQVEVTYEPEPERKPEKVKTKKEKSSIPSV